MYKIIKNSIRLMVAVVIMVLSILVGCSQLYIPSNFDCEFSTENAMEYLKVIAEKPHSYMNTKEHSKVRDYIVETINSNGLKASVQKTDYVVNSTFCGKEVRPFRGPVENIVVKLKGKKEGKLILASAHYDSVYNGPGAGDNGLGVVTLLETLRVLSKGTTLENDIIFLFTDSEEVGLLGAKEFATTYPNINDIALFLNFEGLNSGPCTILEYSEGASWIISKYREAVLYPVSYSFMDDITRAFAYGTDLYEFEEVGLKGLTLSPTSNYFTYHTEFDNIEHMSAKTLQHEGMTALSLLRALGNSNLEEITYGDSVYFNIFSGVMVMYSFNVAIITGIIAVVIFLFLMIIGLKRGMLSIKGICGGFFISLGSLTISFLFGLIIQIVKQRQLIDKSFWLRLVSPQGTRYYNYFVIFIIVFTAVISLFLQGLVYKKINYSNLMVGVMIPWVLMTPITLMMWTKSSYMLTWPTLFSCTALVLVMLTKKSLSFKKRTLAMVLNTFPGLIMFTPLVMLSLDAFTYSNVLFLLSLVVGLITTMISPGFFLLLENEQKSPYFH